MSEDFPLAPGVVILYRSKETQDYICGVSLKLDEQLLLPRQCSEDATTRQNTRKAGKTRRTTLSRVLPRHSMFLKLDINTRDAVLSLSRDTNCQSNIKLGTSNEIQIKLTIFPTSTGDCHTAADIS